MKLSLSFSVIKKYMCFSVIWLIELHYFNILLIILKIKKKDKEYFYFFALILFSPLKNSSSKEFLYKSIKEIVV